MKQKKQKKQKKQQKKLQKKQQKKKKMPDHIEEYFAKEEGSNQAFNSRELFKADKENIDLKTHLTDEEITLINTLFFNDTILKDNGLKQIYSAFIHKYLRLKVSKDRLSRSEFVNTNKSGEQTEDTLNKLSNVKNITDAKR